MNIIKDFSIELRKHKHRHNFLIFIFAILAETMFMYGNYHGKSDLDNSWMLLFYNFPIMNTLFLPVVIAGFSSRLMDVEHKGDMLKSLYTFSTPENIYFTKYLYGALSVIGLVIMLCASFFVNAKLLNLSTDFPIKYLLVFAFTTFISSLTLFTIHLLLSFFFKNQAVSISVGILGSFSGLFSVFLPKSILQKMYPWASYATSLLVGMDWNRETRETRLFLLDPDYTSTVFNLLWLLGLTALAIYLLKKSAIEDNDSGKHYEGSKQVTLHKCPTEFLKLKGSPAWIAFFVVPVLAAIIGTFNYLGNIDILTEGWYSLWSQHTLFICYFFMSVIIGIFVGCIWRVEHTGTNMNLLMTHQSPFRIVLSKYVVTCFITTLSLIWIMALYVISGLIAHVDGSIPFELPGWILLGTIGIYSICAFQIFISLIIRNFVVPVIIGFIGGLSGVGFVAKGIPYFSPYSLFDLAMNQRQLGNANITLFILVSLIFIVGFLSLSTIYLYRADVRSHE